MATLLNGKALSAEIEKDVAEQVARLKQEFGRVPGLATIIVGDRKDSETYVRLKKKGAEECGMVNYGVALPADTTQEALEDQIRRLNADPNVHGILVQLPLPVHLDALRATLCVDPSKDVDGIHPMNMGNLCAKESKPLFVPCTPLGVMTLLCHGGVELKGANAVVVGRSSIVGIPTAHLLLRSDATVTVCHSHTVGIADICRRADIIIAAARSPELVRGNWVKPGAAVVDVGTNPVPDPQRKLGYKLVGDVAFAEVSPHAGYITPVPGGVGPMTISMLMANTLQSFKRSVGHPTSTFAKHVPKFCL